jgi:hypothetical protein
MLMRAWKSVEIRRPETFAQALEAKAEHPG